MKEKIFFKVIEYIDDELISEAAEYRPDMGGGVILNEDEAYGVSTNVVRTRRLWKYPVTVMALLGIVGGAVFVFINYDDDFDSSGYCSDTSVETDISTEGTLTDTTDEKIVQVTPIKVVDIHLWAAFSNEIGFNVLCVDSLPKIPNPTLDKECFSEMSTEELFKYYGLEFLLPKLRNERYAEINDKNVVHGIYTSSEGKIEDVNTFVFKNTGDICSDFSDGWNKLTVTIGKNTQFGQEYNFGYSSFRHDKICYCKDNDTFFVVYNVKGCSVMISGKSDDIMHFSDSYKYSVEDFLKINEGISPSSQAFNWDLFKLFTTTIELMSEEEIEQELNIYNEKVSDWYEEIDEITGEKRYY